MIKLKNIKCKVFVITDSKSTIKTFKVTLIGQNIKSVLDVQKHLSKYFSDKTINSWKKPDEEKQNWKLQQVVFIAVEDWVEEVSFKNTFNSRQLDLITELKTQESYIDLKVKKVVSQINKIDKMFSEIDFEKYK